MPELPGSRATTVGPGGSAGSLPLGGDLESVAASESQAPDPAWIASIANALFRGVPADVATGTGASLPSAPVFAVDAVTAQVPLAPNAAPPVSPNLTPGSSGVPGSGASPPAAPVQAYAPLTTQGQPTPAQAVPPSGEKGTSAPSVPAAPVSFTSASDFPIGNPQQVFASDADLASLPSTLGGAMSIIPSVAGGIPSGAQGGALPSAPVNAGQPFVSSPATAPSPGPTPPFVIAPIGGAGSPAPYGSEARAAPGFGAANPREGYYFLDEGLSASTQASPLPSGVNGLPLDLTALPAQHRSELALPPISGPRQFDAHIFRRDFPILQEYVNGRPLIWLDNAATTQKPQAVIDRLSYFYARENSNVHRAAHALAARSTDAFEAARQKVRRFINAPSDESIVWVRGTTEAINLVAKAWGGRNVGEGDEVVVSNLEHHSNIVPWQMLCDAKGATLRMAPVDDRGDILLDEYEKLLNPKTRIVAFTHVSNALGTVTPARDMIEMAHRHGARVLVDGAQAVCHMPVDVQALGADFYVLSGHKMFGPTGVGVLYGKPEELEAMPPWQGGGSMIKDVTFEKSVFQDPPEKFEAGTGTIADAVGVGAAIDYLQRIGMANIAAYEHGLLEYALEGLRTVPGLKLVGAPRERAGAISLVLDEIRVEDVGQALNQDGIAVRAGHHCAQPILRRFGYETTVRPSFALYNTPEDVDALVAALHRLTAERGRRGY